MSHHKLPEGNYLTVPNAAGIENLQKMYFRYENKSSSIDYKKELEGNYTKLAAGEQPWENAEWLNKVTTQAKKLFDLYKIMDYKNIQEFLPSVYLLLRPALILGDYNASARKVATAVSPEKNIIYANTKMENNEKLYCDSLPTHLLKAEEDSQNFIKLYHHILNKEKSFPIVLFKGQKPNYEQINSFTWQDDFAKKIENLRKDNDNTPFFCSLFAGTGSGKTLGIIKTMQAIAPEVGQARYSLGVGLKTLATQTAHEYWNKEGRIKLKKEDLLVFIGDRIARNEAERVLEEYKEAKEEKKEFNEEELGTSNSLIDKERLEIFSEFDGGAENIVEEIKNYSALSEKDKIILSTPITVATIDHYIPGSELLSGTDAGMSLRLATSDLAIDEIDSFSYSDIPAIQRLIFFSGYFGRSVLLSSASMSFELNKSFFSAWQKGLTAGNLLRTKKITQFGYAFASENFQNSCAHIQTLNSEVNFNHILQSFLNGQIEYLNNQFPRRTLSANITLQQIERKYEEDIRVSWFKSIQKQVISFHKTNANPIVVNEKDYNFSVGFTRFNQIPVAQNFALWLSANATIPDDNFCFVVINYHSKYLRIDRSIIENYLDRNLKWIENDNKYVAKLFSDETLLKFIAKNSQHKNICLVVSTTSIQETGRDHDYDWCILDPCSVKSLVQAAGRVRRHRKWEYNTPNIAILNVPSQVWFSEKEQKNINDPWSFPGFGDYKLFSQPLFLLLRQFPIEKAIPKYTGPMSKANNITNPHKDLIERTKRKFTHLGIQFPIESPEKGFTESESFLNTKKITKIDAQESYFYPKNLTDNPARCYAEIYEKWYADGFNENTWSGTNILSNYILNLFQHSHKMTEFRQSDINSTKKRTSIKLIYTKNRDYYFIQPFEGKFWEIRNKERHEKCKALLNISVDNFEQLSNNVFIGNSKYFLLKLPLEGFSSDVLQKIKDIKDTKCKEEIRESYERLELNLNRDKEYALINGEYKTEAMYIREIGLYYPLKK